MAGPRCARFASTFRQFPRVRMTIDSLEVRAVGPDAVTVAFRWRVDPALQQRPPRAPAAATP